MRAAEQANDAANAAKVIFWRQGYDDASIEDIVEASGVNRYSIYSTYGGKLDVFLAALEIYYLERKAVFIDSLHDASKPPIDAIRDVFEFACGEMLEQGSGCLMCNVATEVARREPAVAERLTSYLEEIEHAYTDALERAHDRGELNQSITPQSGAKLLMALKMGLSAMARNGSNQETMDVVLQTELSLLQSNAKGRKQ